MKTSVGRSRYTYLIDGSHLREVCCRADRAVRLLVFTLIKQRTDQESLQNCYGIVKLDMLRICFRIAASIIGTEQLLDYDGNKTRHALNR